MEMHRCSGCMGITANPVCEKCGWPQGKNNEVHQLSVGSRLREQYMIGRVLGQGGFGITYLGWDDYLEMPVAIKEFYPNAMVTRECTVSTMVHCTSEQIRPHYNMSMKRFLREAKALALLRDVPEVVDVYSFFEENGTAYIIMEYVKGTDLATYVNRRGGRLSPEETFRILRPVMGALDMVHRADMVHRDISPDNIMLHPRGGAKLLDFGAVRNVEGAEAGKDMARSTEAILKHGFAPMEQYQTRGGLGPWTDEYAMCATVYYCLTGRIPPEAPARMLEELEVDFNVPGLPLHQQQALQKGMAVRARDRHGSMRALMEALFPSEQERKQLEPEMKQPPREPGRIPVISVPEPSGKEPVQSPGRMPQPPAEEILGNAPGNPGLNREIPCSQVPVSAPVPKSGKLSGKKKSGLIAVATILAALVLLGVGLFALLPKKSPEKPTVRAEEGSDEWQPGGEISRQPTVEDTTQPPVDYAPEISVWAFPVGKWSDEQYVSSVLDAFHERYPEIRVTVEYLNYIDGDDRIRSDIRKESGPDLLLESPARLVAIWGADGYMADLTDLWGPESADFYPGVEGACTGSDGNMYMYPLCMLVHTMAINRDLFEQAGAMQFIDQESHTWTTEGFIMAMQAVYDYTGETVCPVYCGGQGGDLGTRALISNLYGGTFTDADHTRYTWDREEMIQALELLRGVDGVLFDTDIVGGDAATMFAQGVVPVTLCWNSSLHENFQHADAQFQIMPMAFPAPEGSLPQLEGGVYGFGVVDKGDEARIASAKAFIRFVCDEYSWAHSSGPGFYPVSASVQPQLTPLQQEYLRFLPCYADDYSVTPGWANAREQWWNMLRTIASGGDVRETVMVYTEEANKIH